MDAPDRNRRDRLEQLQAAAKAREHTLAELEAEIAQAARELRAGEAECWSVESRLAEVRAAVRAEATAKSRRSRWSFWEPARQFFSEKDRGLSLVALGMPAIACGAVGWEFHRLASLHVFVAGAALVLLGFFISDVFHGPSAEARAHVQ